MLVENDSSLFDESSIYHASEGAGKHLIIDLVHYDVKTSAVSFPQSQ